MPGLPADLFEEPAKRAFAAYAHADGQFTGGPLSAAHTARLWNKLPTRDRDHWRRAVAAAFTASPDTFAELTTLLLTTQRLLAQAAQFTGLVIDVNAAAAVDGHPLSARLARLAAQAQPLHGAVELLLTGGPADLAQTPDGELEQAAIRAAAVHWQDDHEAPMSNERARAHWDSLHSTTQAKWAQVVTAVRGCAA
jgi:hypothetical protein